MPNSQHDLPMEPDDLRDYLSEVLPESQLMEVRADAHYPADSSVGDTSGHGGVRILERRHGQQL